MSKQTWRWANKWAGWRTMLPQVNDSIIVDVIGKPGFYVVESREREQLRRAYFRISDFCTLRAALAFSADYREYVNGRRSDRPVSWDDKYSSLEFPPISPKLPEPAPLTERSF